MTDLTSLTIAEAREKLKGKEFSALELTDAYLSAIDAANGALNAYVALTPEKAREMAKASDERIAAGKAGELEGVPLGVKDDDIESAIGESVTLSMEVIEQKAKVIDMKGE